LSKSSIKRKENTDSSPDYKLGMFPGVFTPSILTILGIILFLRMGYTVGHAGLGKALILVALASFFIGGIIKWDYGVMVQNFAAPNFAESNAIGIDKGLPFWVLFAIFFPAVTGFTQGVNMSGDLKEPGKAIPIGTFLAVGVSTIIYFLAAIVFSGSMPNAELIADYGAMKKISLVPWFIHAGVIAATLSSAMAPFMNQGQQVRLFDRDFTGLIHGSAWQDL